MFYSAALFVLGALTGLVGGLLGVSAVANASLQQHREVDK